MNPTQILSLYRKLLRLSTEIPSHNHRQLTRHRIRTDFRKHKTLAINSAEQHQALQLAEIQLENLEFRLEHMKEILKSEMLVHPAGQNNVKQSEEATQRLKELDREEFRQKFRAKWNRNNNNSSAP